ncbi:MAG: hypothetical protein U9N35_06120, partial [Euryarchaeota archaeon]|nr:hypothetical protein [Euryarchaeota archaeon]
MSDKMPGERYDYEKFVKEIESRYGEKLEKGGHITITEEESSEFFGSSIEKAKTGHCILENNEDPKELKRKGHATIVYHLGERGYSSRVTMKNEKRVLEVWKPTSKKKLDRKYHLLGASAFSGVEEAADMIETTGYLYSGWNYNITEDKRKHLSKPFRLYVGEKKKIKGCFRVVDFWTDIEEDKDLGKILDDESWRDHFRDNESAIDPTQWNNKHDETWKTRTIFRYDKVERFSEEKDLSEFENIEGEIPQFYQTGFDVIFEEKKKEGRNMNKKRKILLNLWKELLENQGSGVHFNTVDRYRQVEKFRDNVKIFIENPSEETFKQ